MITSGLLLALAMMKPHATGLMIVPFIVTGCWVPVVIAIVAVVISFAVFCVYLPTDPINALNTLLNNAGGGKLWSQSHGICSFASDFGLGLNTVYFMSAAIAVVYMMVLIGYLKKNGIGDILSVSIPVAIALSFWFYECSHDEYIIFIPRMALCLYGARSGN